MLCKNPECKNQSKARGLCKPCYYQWQRQDPEWLAKRQKRSRDWANKNKERATKYRRALRYGLTAQEVDAMLIEQNYICAIKGCNNNAEHIDHCHITGRVRAILCSTCNIALGHIEIKRHLLTAMLDYIDSF